MRITIDEAVALFLQDQVVAIPTETVYGLAAPLTSPCAIEKIFSLKKRPASNPLIIHVKNKQECLKYVSLIPPHFDALVDLFWPGPLTLILPIQPELIPDVARAGLSTCGFRMPRHSLTQALLEKCSPLVAPSANLSGKPSATQAAHIETDFGIHFPVVDGGQANHGLESTILAFNEVIGKWQLARLGALSKEALSEALGYAPDETKAGERPICPGQLFRHYAPNTRLILDSKPHSAHIVGFSDRSYADAKKVYSLGSCVNPEEVAHNLYNTLRQLDVDGVDEATVDINLPQDGLWLTILERLTKAANQ